MSPLDNEVIKEKLKKKKLESFTFKRQTPQNWQKTMVFINSPHLVIFTKYISRKEFNN